MRASLRLHFQVLDSEWDKLIEAPTPQRGIRDARAALLFVMQEHSDPAANGSCEVLADCDDAAQSLGVWDYTGDTGEVVWSPED